MISRRVIRSLRPFRPPRRCPVPGSQSRLGCPYEHAAALLAAKDLVLRRGADPVEVDGVEGEMAALALTAVQRRRADPAELVAQLLVQREQVARDVFGHGGTGGAGGAGLLVDLTFRAGTAVGELGELALSRRLLLAQAADAGLG